MDKPTSDLDDLRTASLDQKQANLIELRRISIKHCAQSLVHSCRCQDTNCSLSSCPKMKRAFQHYDSCKQRINGVCPVCKQLIALCCYHSKRCEEAECPVPFCDEIKRKLRQQKLPTRVQQSQMIKRRISSMKAVQSRPVTIDGQNMTSHSQAQSSPPPYFNLPDSQPGFNMKLSTAVSPPGAITAINQAQATVVRFQDPIEVVGFGNGNSVRSPAYVGPGHIAVHQHAGPTQLQVPPGIQQVRQPIPGQMMGGPPQQQGPSSPGMGVLHQLLGQRSNKVPPVLEQFLQTLKSPKSSQQKQQVLAIFKSHPQLMAAFIKRRTSAFQQQHHQQLMQKHQQQRQQEQQLMQQQEQHHQQPMQEHQQQQHQNWHLMQQQEHQQQRHQNWHLMQQQEHQHQQRQQMMQQEHQQQKNQQLMQQQEHQQQQNQQLMHQQEHHQQQNQQLMHQQEHHQEQQNQQFMHQQEHHQQQEQQNQQFMHQQEHQQYQLMQQHHGMTSGGMHVVMQGGHPGMCPSGQTQPNQQVPMTNQQQQWLKHQHTLVQQQQQQQGYFQPPQTPPYDQRLRQPHPMNFAEYRLGFQVDIQALAYQDFAPQQHQQHLEQFASSPNHPSMSPQQQRIIDHPQPVPSPQPILSPRNQLVPSPNHPSQAHSPHASHGPHETSRVPTPDPYQISSNSDMMLPQMSNFGMGMSLSGSLLNSDKGCSWEDIDVTPLTPIKDKLTQYVENL